MGMRGETTAPELVSEDRVLARRMVRGDEAAFDEFFDEHLPGLYRFALARLQDPDLTREVVQTSICNAIAHIRTYRGEAPLAAWLYTICRNEIRRHYKKKGRSPAVTEFVEETPEVQAALESLWTGAADPEAALEQKEAARLVHAVLDCLPPRYGHALEWKYLDGLSVREIAERLNVGPKAAESLLTRARQAFRDGFAAAARDLTAWIHGAA